MGPLPHKSQTGQAIVEYAIISALVILTLIFALRIFGVSLSNLYCRIAEGLNVKGSLGCSVYLNDSFDSLKNWRSFYGPNPWQIKNGKLCTTSTADQRILDQNALPSSDYRITVDPAQLNSGNGYGVMFRQAPSGSSYAGYDFQVDPGLGNKFAFRRYDYNGAELSTPLSTASFPAGFNISAPHKVEVLVKGNTFTAFVDGKQVLTATDSTYSSGKVGFRTWDSSNACFDNLTVTPP